MSVQAEPAPPLRQATTLAWRSILKIRTNVQDLMAFSVQPIMLLLLFTYVFGGAISGGTRQYLQFVLPGLLVQIVLFATLGTGLMLNQDIATGVFDRFRSLPIARWTPLAGAILGDGVRYLIALAEMLLLGVILGFRIRTGVLPTIADLLLILAFAFAMCWVTALFGMVAKSAQGVQSLGFSIMFPLVFASNVLVPEKTMPGWLRHFVSINPLTALAEASRGLLVGGPVAQPVERSLFWIFGILVVFAPLAVRAYMRRV